MLLLLLSFPLFILAVANSTTILPYNAPCLDLKCDERSPYYAIPLNDEIYRSKRSFKGTIKKIPLLGKLFRDKNHKALVNRGKSNENWLKKLMKKVPLINKLFGDKQTGTITANQTKKRLVERIPIFGKLFEEKVGGKKGRGLCELLEKIPLLGKLFRDKNSKALVMRHGSTKENKLKKLWKRLFGKKDKGAVIKHSAKENRLKRILNKFPLIGKMFGGRNAGNAALGTKKKLLEKIPLVGKLFEKKVGGKKGRGLRRLVERIPILGKLFKKKSQKSPAIAGAGGVAPANNKGVMAKIKAWLKKMKLNGGKGWGAALAIALGLGVGAICMT